jgi:hypothetical protein
MFAQHTLGIRKPHGRHLGGLNVCTVRSVRGWVNEGTGDVAREEK